MKKHSRKVTPKPFAGALGAGLVAILARRKAGAHKHRNASKGGAKKPNHFEGWE